MENVVGKSTYGCGHFIMKLSYQLHVPFWEYVDGVKISTHSPIDYPR